jgi:hypothetical protein
MSSCDSKITGSGSIRSQIVRDQLVWDKSILSLRMSFSAARLFLLLWTRGQNDASACQCRSSSHQHLGRTRSRPIPGLDLGLGLTAGSSASAFARLPGPGQGLGLGVGLTAPAEARAWAGMGKGEGGGDVDGGGKGLGLDSLGPPQKRVSGIMERRGLTTARMFSRAFDAAEELKKWVPTSSLKEPTDRTISTDQ